MNSIIRELKKKREVETQNKSVDEGADVEQLKYEEIYSKEDIKDVDSFIKDMEDIGGEVVNNQDDITVRVPLELKESLKEVESKYFETDEATTAKKVSKRGAGGGNGGASKRGTRRKLTKKTADASDEYFDYLASIKAHAKKYKLKTVNKYSVDIAERLENYLEDTSSSWEMDINDALLSNEILKKKEFLEILLRALGNDFVEMAIDESFENDEAFGVSTGFEDVITISGSKDELVAIAKKCGLDIKDVKLNKVTEKEFKSGNIFGIVEGTHLVAMAKDKKHTNNLLLIVDKDEYIPDAEVVNESAEDDMIIKVAGNDFPMKNLLKTDKNVSKRIKEIVKEEKGTIDMDFFGNTIYAKLHEDFPEYFNDTFNGILSELGRPLTKKELKVVTKNIDNLEEDDDLWEQKDISKYILDNYDESSKDDEDTEECYEMEIPMERLIDEDGNQINTSKILRVIKSCKGVNEAEALEDCIRVKYDESCEDELLEKLEECGIEVDIEDEE